MKKLINSYKKWNPSTLATILLLSTPFLMFLLTDFKLDNDFWFLINTGKEIVKNGFISVEPFTIHTGMFFLPQQWLTDILFHFIYHNFGIYGMYTLVLLCNALIIYLFYRIAYFMSNSRKIAILLTMITDSLLIVMGIITTRPQLFDIIVFSILLFIMELYVKKQKPKYLFFIPLLSFFLINAHASMWVMLFVFLLPYYAEYVILKFAKRDTFKILPLIIVTVISGVIAFINPYGIEPIIYLFNSYGISQINLAVNEMKIIDISTPFGKLIYLGILTILYTFYKNKGSNKIRFCFLVLGIGYLSLLHYKSLAFLAVIIPIVVAYNLRNENNLSDTESHNYEKIIYTVLIVCVLALTLFKVHLDDDVKIKDFADYLDENASFDIKLFTDYNNGSYMEYRGYKCYIDPRAEVFLQNNNHKEDIFDEYFKLENNDIDIDAFLDKYNFDYLLVTDTTKSLFKNLQSNKEYDEVLSKEISKDNMIILYKKVGETIEK